MKLEARDLRVLALLGTRTRTVDDLAGGLDLPPEVLDERLTEMADNGLVYDCGDGRYERTESGRRVLVASATGTDDERVDTSPEVEDALDAFDLGPAEADAVRHAFALLRYWGRVTGEEIADAVFSEAPAGRDTPAAWWDEVVSEPLAALPGVEPPARDDDPWRYTGVAEADQPGTHGRRVLSRLHPVYGDVKHALESLDLSEAEREAARAAFGFLYRRGEATEAEVSEAVYPDHPAGYPSAEAWWEGAIRDTFEAMPGVERIGGTWNGDGGSGGERPNGRGWRYVQP